MAGLRRADPALAVLIPDLARIVAFRNVLIHGYATVDDRLVWGVVERDLPVIADNTPADAGGGGAMNGPAPSLTHRQPPATPPPHRD